MSHGPELPMEDEGTESPPGYFLGTQVQIGSRVPPPSGTTDRDASTSETRRALAAEQLALGHPNRTGAHRSSNAIVHTVHQGKGFTGNLPGESEPLGQTNPRSSCMRMLRPHKPKCTRRFQILPGHRRRQRQVWESLTC